MLDFRLRGNDREKDQDRFFGNLPEKWLDNVEEKGTLYKFPHKDVRRTYFLTKASAPLARGRRFFLPDRLLKNAHLRRYPHSSSLRRTSMYASLFGISGALHLAVFEQPVKQVSFRNLLNRSG
jgi:hypothetical protein